MVLWEKGNPEKEGRKHRSKGRVLQVWTPPETGGVMDATQLRVRYSDDCATVEREIRQVTDVTEEDSETTEGKDVAGGLVRGGQKTRRKRRSYLVET